MQKTVDQVAKMQGPNAMRTQNSYKIAATKNNRWPE